MENKIFDKYAELILYLKDISHEIYFDQSTNRQISLNHGFKLFKLEKDERYEERVIVEITYSRPMELTVFYTDSFVIFELNSNLVIIFIRTSMSFIPGLSPLPDKVHTIFEFPLEKYDYQDSLFILLLTKIELFLNEKFNFSDDYYCDIIEKYK